MPSSPMVPWSVMAALKCRPLGCLAKRLLMGCSGSLVFCSCVSRAGKLLLHSLCLGRRMYAVLPGSELVDFTAPCIAAAAPLMLNYWVIFNLEKLQLAIGILYPQWRAGGRMWGRHCGGWKCGSPLQRARFQGLMPPAALCLPGCAARLLLARHGWSFSLDSHGEGTEQLQT